MAYGAPRIETHRQLNRVQHSTQNLLFSAFAFVLGAAVGSFLNVCIYRWPVDLSINPAASLVLSAVQTTDSMASQSSVDQLARAWRPMRKLRRKIAFRYFAVELVTHFFSLRSGKGSPWQVAIAYWIFVSFLIIGTFIDFEHFIIPDRVTIGGTIAGVACSVVVPALMQTRFARAAGVRAGTGRCARLRDSLDRARSGKIAFGRKRIEFDAPTTVHVDKTRRRRRFRRAERRKSLERIFAREKDQLLLHCDEVRIDDREYGEVTLTFRYDRVERDGHVLMLDDVTHISGITRELVIPREAMGRGDLKFLAAIGAFLGWRAVLFSLFAGSLLGSVIGLGYA
jgi:leader peptidase (prepilin peptidase)/N-methyltransferase